MDTATRYELWLGREAPPEDSHVLRAGPVSAVLVGPDLRNVRLGTVELVQRVYVAVRDSGWNTIPGEMSNPRLDIEDSEFRISFDVHHRYEDIDYSWTATITGDRDGTISYAMDGKSHGSFQYNKIGFNLHHPLRESVGQPYRARTETGEIEGSLPELIDPQLIVDGQLTGMFDPYTSLTIDLHGGVTVQFDFEGDLFELHDHRNWTDANYKSYGTPLAVPYPMPAEPGQRFHQKVTIRPVTVPDSLQEPAPEISVDVGGSLGRGLPKLGAGMPSHGEPPSERERRLLAALELDHVRVDLHLKDPSFPDALRLAEATAKAIGAGLQLALFLSSNAEEEIQRLKPRLEKLSAPVRQVLVFEEVEGFSTFLLMTSARLVETVRSQLRESLPDALIAGGTNQFFTELNRDWSDVRAGDGIVYSMNPQVHACDDTSLMENLEGQAETVRSTRHYAGNHPILISPVTFIGRSGPFPAGPPQPGGLPGVVDVRQASLFGAAWTVGSIQSLSSVDVYSITYFETTGWLGVMERDEGSPDPDRFPSKPGAVFPLYHVFADLAEWRSGELTEATSSDPLRSRALAVRTSDGFHLLVANLTAQPQRVILGPIQGGEVSLRVLDEETAPQAMAHPEEFRSHTIRQKVENGRLELQLTPYAVARIEVAETI